MTPTLSFDPETVTLMGRVCDAAWREETCRELGATEFMPTDLSKITTVEAADQAIKETEETIARGETAVIEGSPTDVEMLEACRIELQALKNHRAALAIS